MVPVCSSVLSLNKANNFQNTLWVKTHIHRQSSVKIMLSNFNLYFVFRYLPAASKLLEMIIFYPKSLSTLLCEEMKRGKLSALPTNIDIKYYGRDVPTLNWVLKPILTVTAVWKTGDMHAYADYTLKRITLNFNVLKVYFQNWKKCSFCLCYMSLSENRNDMRAVKNVFSLYWLEAWNKKNKTG